MALGQSIDKNTNVRYSSSMRKGESTKTNILDQAVQLASVYGLSGLTIGNLARHSHMSKGGICAHFPSKQALQLAAIAHAADIFKRAVILPALTASSGQERLQALSEAWLAYVQQGVFLGGCFFTNAVLELDDLDDQEVRDAARVHYQRFLDFVGHNATKAIQTGQFHSIIVGEQFVFEFVSILLGAVVWRGLGQQHEGISRARRAIETLILQARN